MNPKICLIYNYAQHYRTSIFRLIDERFNCNFVFGDKYLDIKKMDYSILSHSVTEVKNNKIGPVHYQSGVLSLLFNDYDTYLMLGDIRCCSTWAFAALARLFPNKKVYFWSHGLLSDKSRLKTFIYKIFFTLPNGSFIYNNRSRKLLIKNGIKSSKLFTIYNSLAYDDQIELRNRVKHTSLYKDHFHNENKTIIFIGRLTQVKRLDLIIDALIKLKEKHEYYNLVLIGDGVNRPFLENYVSEKNMKDQVWFYGACYDELRNAELIFNADLCVSPGNIGLTAMHSLMFGCPAVTNDDFDTQMPEFESIIDGKTGTFFVKNNVDDLVKKISNWFNIHGKERESIRENCYAEIDSYWNPHNQIKILENVLKRNK